VLENEFFRFVLQPHSEALQRAYGINFEAIAVGIQAAADAIRSGHSNALTRVRDGMQQCSILASNQGISLEAATKQRQAREPDFAHKMSEAMRDLFYGGVCNLSRHTTLPPVLLQDLAYVPGEETEFFADGNLCGTPMRRLPARVKPLVVLDNEYYATDGQFVRDSAYRSIQRGLGAVYKVAVRKHLRMAAI
jgi:hypothetical protein